MIAFLLWALRYVEWSRWSKLNNKILPGCQDFCYTTVQSSIPQPQPIGHYDTSIIILCWSFVALYNNKYGSSRRPFGYLFWQIWGFGLMFYHAFSQSIDTWVYSFGRGIPHRYRAISEGFAPVHHHHAFLYLLWPLKKLKISQFIRLVLSVFQPIFISLNFYSFYDGLKLN